MTELSHQPLFTNEQKAEMTRNWETADQDHRPVVQVSLYVEDKPAMRWLFYVLDPEYPDLASGLCDHGWGKTFMDMIDVESLIKEATIRNGVLKRDDFTAQHPMSVYEEAAEWKGHITTDETDLSEAANRIRIRKKIERPQNGLSL